MRTCYLAAGVAALLLALQVLASLGAFAQDRMPTVDVALVLAADVSISMKAEEVALQRQAYAAALTHPDTVQAVAEGAHGRILVTYFEWSGCDDQELIVGWTSVADEADLRMVAAAIIAAEDGGVGGITCIGAALNRAEALLAIAPEAAERMIVDVSGDGTDNGSNLTQARESLLARGATINGLPIMVAPDQPGLADYYARNVVGGPAHFVEPATTVHDLERALRRKLVQEIG